MNVSYINSIKGQRTLKYRSFAKMVPMRHDSEQRIDIIEIPFDAYHQIKKGSNYQNCIFWLLLSFDSSLASLACSKIQKMTTNEIELNSIYNINKTEK